MEYYIEKDHDDNYSLSMRTADHVFFFSRIMERSVISSLRGGLREDKIIYLLDNSSTNHETEKILDDQKSCTCLRMYNGNVKIIGNCCIGETVRSTQLRKQNSEFRIQYPVYSCDKKMYWLYERLFCP